MRGITLLTATALLLTACGQTRPNARSPMETVESFHRALSRHDWRAASQHLSSELRQQNGSAVSDAAFYSTHYWTTSRGLESLRHDDPPLLENGAHFELANQTSDWAEVRVFYAQRREKSVRLHLLVLRREGEAGWRIAEFFGRTTRASR